MPRPRRRPRGDGVQSMLKALEDAKNDRSLATQGIEQERTELQAKVGTLTATVMRLQTEVQRLSQGGAAAASGGDDADPFGSAESQASDENDPFAETEAADPFADSTSDPFAETSADPGSRPARPGRRPPSRGPARSVRARPPVRRPRRRAPGGRVASP